MLELNNSKELQRYFLNLKSQKLNHLLLTCSCMLAVQSTNLSLCAKRMAKVTGEDISYNTAYSRLKRFFQTGLTEPILQGVCLLVIYTFCCSENCYLLLDRTNWKYGKLNINLLVVGVLYRDVFIPLVWKDLGRAGNSNSEQRLALIDKLLKWWSLSTVPLPELHIAGDREFIGFKWFKGLEERGIKFVMRIPVSFKIQALLNGKIKDRRLQLSVIQRYLSWTGLDSIEAVLESEYIVKLCVFDNDSTRAKAKHIYLMTNMEDVSEASVFYRKRYKIEVCFKHLKSSGLNLEDTSLEGQHKMDLMFAVLTIVYLMAIQKGVVHFEKNGQQEMKMFFDPKPYIAPAKSVFMKGFECIMAQIFTLEEFTEGLYQLVKWRAKQQNPLYQHFYT